MKIRVVLMAAVALLMMSAFAVADTPGQHPAYLHALTDLRHARAHLDKLTPNGRVDADEQRAIEEIDAAIREIKEAAIDDGKPLSDHPPVDARWEYTDRMHRSLELLNRAYDDVDKHESDEWARGLKHRALHHIREAQKAVHHAMHDEWHE